MQVNGNINFTGRFLHGDGEFTDVRDDTYQNGLHLIKGLIGGGYVGSSIWDAITILKFANDSWSTSSSTISVATKYGGWASFHTAGYVFLNVQNGRTDNNKIIFATETRSTIGNRTYGGEAPSTVQEGVYYDGFAVARGRYAWTCGTDSSGHDRLDTTVDTFASRSGAPSTAHAVGWFDDRQGWFYNHGNGVTSNINFTTEGWQTQATTPSNATLGLGHDGRYLGKGVNSKEGKFYYGTYYYNEIWQFRNYISTWLVNSYNQTLYNAEHAGTMGQTHGYLAGGYNPSSGQNAHTDKIKYATDVSVQISDAPRSLSSASPMWSNI